MKPQRVEGKGGWAVLAMVVLAGVSAFAFTSVPRPSTTAVVSTGVQEVRRYTDACPGERDSVVLRVDTGAVTFIIRHVPLSKEIANIPEFHDCQRFIVKDSLGTLRYDSLFAVFASYRLDSLVLDQRKSQDTVTVSYRQTRVVVKTVPVATIYSDHRDYPPLGIAEGFNCLLLYELAPRLWGAKMIPLIRPDSNCLSVNPHMEGTTLQVQASSTPRLTESDYPAAARWDWAPVDSEQYIGIKCGPAWCQVGRVGFDTSASYAGPPLPFRPIGPAAFSSAERRRVTAVKGWYDEQRLDSGSQTYPSSMRGSLIPNPDIHGLMETPDRYSATWVQVGFAVVTGGVYGKWNYSQQFNEILVCHGSASKCNVDVNQPTEPPAAMSLHSCPTEWWEAVRPLRLVMAVNVPRFIHVGVTKYFCLVKTSHAAELAHMNAMYGNVVSSLPGTARWRWLLNDEGSWFGCISSSCCTKH